VGHLKRLYSSGQIRIRSNRRIVPENLAAQSCLMAPDRIDAIRIGPGIGDKPTSPGIIQAPDGVAGCIASRRQPPRKRSSRQATLSYKAIRAVAKAAAREGGGHAHDVAAAVGDAGGGDRNAELIDKGGIGAICPLLAQFLNR